MKKYFYILRLGQERGRQTIQKFGLKYQIQISLLDEMALKNIIVQLNKLPVPHQKSPIRYEKNKAINEKPIIIAAIISGLNFSPFRIYVICSSYIYQYPVDQQVR